MILKPPVFDPELHASLRERFGGRVPPIEQIQVRPGLHQLVVKLFEALHEIAPAERTLDVVEIKTMGAGILEIADIPYPDTDPEIVALCTGVFDVIGTAAAETRELCGGKSRFKLELPRDPNTIIGLVRDIELAVCEPCAEAADKEATEKGPQQ